VNDDFDLDRIRDVPDPLEGAGAWPLPPRPAGPAVLPPSPTRAAVAALRTKALVAAVVYELVWIAVMNKRADLSTLPPARLLFELGVPLAASLLALAAAVGSGKDGLGEPKGKLMTLALLSPAIFVASTLFVSPADVDTDGFWAHAVRCLLWTGLYSAGPLVLAAWAFRHAFPASPAWRTAALGLACGAIGAATMSLVCSVGSPAHVLVGHGGIMLLAGIAGALVGRRFGQS
jgi:hypothetical protein